ncbi:HEAT repeat domain-containing protein [Cerasicoccus frondis]|uniref:HEAT repeat domain-containing protein n=1 Tax=Cerasicoccus frondis TaxID=490090 RepID=UPI0028525F08|nr:HEAT repeat domain-containing protein [Cerasicoccus frondis]
MIYCASLRNIIGVLIQASLWTMILSGCGQEPSAESDASKGGKPSAKSASSALSSIDDAIDTVLKDLDGDDRSRLKKSYRQWASDPNIHQDIIIQERGWREFAKKDQSIARFPADIAAAAISHEIPIERTINDRQPKGFNTQTLGLMALWNNADSLNESDVERALPALVDILGSEYECEYGTNEKVKHADLAQAVLLEMSDKSTSAVVNLLLQQDLPTPKAIHVLSTIKPSNAQDMAKLKTLYNGTDNIEIRVAILEAAERGNSVEFMKEIYLQQDPVTSGLAGHALLMQRNQDYSPIWSEALQQEKVERHVANMAAAGLKKNPTAESAPLVNVAMRSARSDESMDMARIYIFKELLTYEDIAADIPINYSGISDNRDREQHIKTIYENGGEASLDFLKYVAKYDPSPDVRDKALTFFADATNTPKESIQLEAQPITQLDFDLALNASRRFDYGHGEIDFQVSYTPYPGKDIAERLPEQQAEYASFLTEALASPIPYDRRGAIMLAGSLSNESHVPALAELYLEERTMNDDRMQRAVIDALANTGSPQATEFVCQWIRDYGKEGYSDFDTYFDARDGDADHRYLLELMLEPEHKEIANRLFDGSQQLRADFFVDQGGAFPTAALITQSLIWEPAPGQQIYAHILGHWKAEDITSEALGRVDNSLQAEWVQPDSMINALMRVVNDSPNETVFTVLNALNEPGNRDYFAAGIQAASPDVKEAFGTALRKRLGVAPHDPDDVGMHRKLLQTLILVYPDPAAYQAELEASVVSFDQRWPAWKKTPNSQLFIQDMVSLTSEPTVEAIVAYIGDESTPKSKRSAAYQTLQKMGNLGFDGMFRLMEHENPDIRKQAIKNALSSTDPEMFARKFAIFDEDDKEMVKAMNFSKTYLDDGDMNEVLPTLIADSDQRRFIYLLDWMSNGKLLGRDDACIEIYQATFNRWDDMTPEQQTQFVNHLTKYPYRFRKADDTVEAFDVVLDPRLPPEALKKLTKALMHSDIERNPEHVALYFKVVNDPEATETLLELADDRWFYELTPEAFELYLKEMEALSERMPDQQPTITQAVAKVTQEVQRRSVK